jgi:hypothetical protein
LFYHVLSRYITSPVAQRQALLQASYGFTCTCSRCKSELDLLDTDVGRSVLAVYKEVEEDSWRDVVMSAVENRDMEALQECQQEMLSTSNRLLQGMRQERIGFRV